MLANSGDCQSNWAKPDKLAVADHLAASWRHSAKAAARCQLKMSRRLGIDPVPNMTELLEEKGIKVLLLDLPDSVSGLTCSVTQSHDDTPLSVIVVNAMHSLERRRLTLAHELGHRVAAE